MLHRDIANADFVAKDPVRFGPFEPWFFMGVAALEIVMMLAFIYAIIMSIIHRKKLEDHAWWLISSVFLIMMPALGRGVQNVYIGMNSKDWPNINIMYPLFIAQGIIIAMVLLGAWKYGKMRHPATWLAVGLNVFLLFLEPIGRSAAVQAMLRNIIKG
jgi:hypothetical protein